MRNCYGRTDESEKALWVSEKVLTGTEGVCCGGEKQNGEDFITRDRLVTGQRRVLMSGEELRGLFIAQNVLTAGEMLVEGILQLG